MEYFPPDLASLCDDQWHSVHLVKDRMTGTLSIDGADPMVEVSDTDFVSLQLNSPLYVGGVPGKISASNTTSVMKSSYFQLPSHSELLF